MKLMRYLGIDYGSKRIGIALSDDGGRIAFPAGAIVNRGKTLLKEIATRIASENVGLVVVGIPIGLNGKETEQTRMTRSFIKALKKVTDITIETENEIFTSRIAADSGMEDGHIDASSAAIILQSYLDKKNAKL